MLRRTLHRRAVNDSINHETGVMSMQAEGVPEPLINRMHARKGTWGYAFKARVFNNSYRKAGTLVAVFGSVYFVFPYGLRFIQEIRGSTRFSLETADIAMPDLSVLWWKNEWRKGATLWRAGESTPNFYAENSKWIELNTGRKMFDENTIPIVPLNKSVAKKVAIPARAGIHQPEATDITSQPIADTSSSYLAPEDNLVLSRRGQMKALVPLAGDSPILTVLLEKGYFVDAIECSEVALKSLRGRLRAWSSYMYYGDHSAAEKANYYNNNRITNTTPEQNLRVHWCDFFDPLLWTILPTGMTPQQRKNRQDALARKEAQDLLPKGEALAQSVFDTMNTESETVSGSTLIDALSEKRGDEFREMMKGAEMEGKLKKYQEEFIAKESGTMFDLPLLSKGIKDEKYDFIYDREGITAVNPEDRQNYAFFLKRSLKEDGILFVEGTFRTGRVKGNKIRGPPFSLGEDQLTALFPKEQGYNVKCDSDVPDKMFSIDRENRILGRIPKNLYVTPIPCVVWKKAAEDTRRLRELAAERAALEDSAASAE